MNQTRVLVQSPCRALSLAAASLALILLPVLPACAQTLPHVWSGAEIGANTARVTGLIDNTEAFGSGAVVRYPRVVVSCAHVTFDPDLSDPWLAGGEFSIRYHGGSMEPASGSGRPLRGYFRFDSYASNAQSRGQDSALAFSVDVVAYYAYEDLAGGAFATSVQDGTGALKTSYAKLVYGYPIGLYDFTPNKSNAFNMHETGPFYGTAYSELSNYVDIDNVGTAAGNSGGPIYVQDPNTGIYNFAGVLVSGTDLNSQFVSTGFRGMDTNAWNLAANALTASGSTAVVTAPAIVTQPASTTATAGGSATFSVTATGSGLNYQWRKDGVNLSGATGATYTISGVTASTAGTFTVVVSNSLGSVTSNGATLTVSASASSPGNASYTALAVQYYNATARYFNMAPPNYTLGYYNWALYNLYYQMSIGNTAQGNYLYAKNYALYYFYAYASQNDYASAMAWYTYINNYAENLPHS